MAGQSEARAIALRGGAPPRLRAVPVLAGLLVSAAVAACGGSSQSNASSPSSPGGGSTGTGKGGVTVAYSQCMRGHGLPNFPDPNSQGAIELKASSGSGANQIDPNSPQYIAAQKACQKLAGSGTTPAEQSHEVAQALKFTACMRAHGV